MSMTSVGQIGLDLVVNQKQFNKQMTGITGLAKKAGIAMAAAFSVKKLIEFGNECARLGSDLQEVQNVVNVVFPSMTKQIDDFSQNAVTAFGLSETMAKKFTGTFGAMAKSFGFTAKQAYDMSTALTGLVGDVASFYNLKHEEAYTKLKSVFTGETETLKDLGVVMTQNALDAYAMAKGYGKVTAKMSEAEKVALRFAFVRDKLSAATGDFARTSDSWANQTRILKLQFDSLKAAIGQGLINVLTPVIKVINTLLGKLMTLANGFKAFTELITGNKSSGSSGVGSGIVSATEATDGLVSSTEGVGTAAKKAAKEMKALMGFDNLNVISTSKDSGAGEAAAGNIDFGNLAESSTAIGQTENKLNPLIERMKELANLFKEGFKAGLGDDFESSLQRVKGHLTGIKDSLIDIATDGKVVESFNGMCNKIAYAAGQVTGATVSVGTTVAENLLGGIDKYLDQNKQFIKDRFIGIFDATGEIGSLIGDFAESFAGIFEVFRSDTAKQATADFIGIISNSFLSAIQLGLELIKDLLNGIIQPVLDNADKIKEALGSTIEPIGTVLAALNNLITDTFGKIFETYDAKIKPAFEGITAGISSMLGTVLDTYNQYVAPVLQEWAGQFNALVEKAQPAIDALIELFGDIMTLIETLWNQYCVPFVNWITGTIVPILMPIIEKIGSVIMKVAGEIFKILQGLFEILSGIINFIVGFFTGDWEKAWDGIKQVFEGVWNVIEGIILAVWEAIVGIIQTAIEIVKGVIETVFETIKGIVLSINEGIKNSIEFVWGFITHFLENANEIISGFISEKWEHIKNIVSTVAKGIKETIQSQWEAVKTNTSTAFNTVKDTFKSTWDTSLLTVKSTTGAIKNSITTNLNAAKEGVVKIFDAIKSSISTKINAALNVVKLAISKIKGCLNFKWQLPKLKLPHFTVEGGFSLSPPKVPKFGIKWYAKGGIIKNPTLAMMGEGNKQEAVVPLDRNLGWRDAIVEKLLEKMPATGQSDAGGITAAEYRAIMRDTVIMFAELIGKLQIQATVDRKEICQVVKQENDIAIKRGT